jgi:hypothetical protein
MKVKEPKPLETVEQQRVVNWLRSREPDIAFFSVPNGANKSIAARIKFKREGLDPGVPDILIVTKSPKKDKPIAIEMKRAVNHKAECTCLSPEQKQWHVKLINNGWIIIVAHGAEEAIADLEALGY